MLHSVQVAEAYVPLWQGGFEHYAFYGGRGGGKSHGIAEASVVLACKNAERVVCGRQYQNSIKDSVKELLEKKIYALGMSVFFRSTDRELINVSTGSRFSFIGMDRNPESAKSLEGATLFWGEEAHTFTTHSIELIVPTIRAPGSRMVWSWNPRFRDDEVDAMFRGPYPPENSYVREVSWRDNPYFFQTRMPSELRRSLLAKPKRHAHIWEGGYDENPDTAVFTDWEIGRVPIPEKAVPLFGMDFGYGSDPNVLVKVYLLEEINVLYVAQEAVGVKVSNNDLDTFMDTVTESRDFPITADSSRPETIEFVNSKGFNVFPSIKGAGSVKNGLNYMEGFKIVVDPDCPITANEIRNYRWMSDPNGKPLPIPEKNQPDHCIDAIRYAIEENSRYGSDSDGVDYL